MNLARLSLLSDVGNPREPLQKYAFGPAEPRTAETGMVTNVEIGEEKTQKDYYDKATHYDLVWGLDNIHLGYYPHLMGNGLVKLDNVQAADALTKRMIEVGQITHTSTVLDLGCGKGQACRVIAERTGARVTGVDLGTTNIQRANEVAASRPDLRMKFFEGSFTDIPSEVASEKYSVVFSQVAFCHVHKLLPTILEQVKRVLAPGGVLIVNDYLGGDKGVSDTTKEHVWKRLHFEYLHGHMAWRNITEESGFVIQSYENLDRHMAQTYRDMAKKADHLGLKSTDNTPLALNYSQTVHAIEVGEVGMNLACLSLLSDIGNHNKSVQQFTPASTSVHGTGEAGIVTNVEIGEEKTQKDYYDKATHYDLIWGLDNIHLGYYPHLIGSDLVVLDNVGAADALTQRMIEVGQINHKSTVLDLGCGKGQACRVIAEYTGARVTGIDLGTTNIQRANEVARSRKDLRMKFYEGSFTDLPSEVASKKYNVVFSQVAFCHVHTLLPTIL